MYNQVRSRIGSARSDNDNVARSRLFRSTVSYFTSQLHGLLDPDGLAHLVGGGSLRHCIGFVVARLLYLWRTCETLFRWTDVQFLRRKDRNQRIMVPKGYLAALFLYYPSGLLLKKETSEILTSWFCSLSADESSSHINRPNNKRRYSLSCAAYSVHSNCSTSALGSK
jgi:hypothetical protein